MTTLAANQPANTQTLDFKTQLKDLIPSLRKYAYTFTRNPDEVLDLVQDTLTRALNKQHLYKEENNFKSWTYTIMRNIFINAYRRRVKFPSVNVEDYQSQLAEAPQQQQSVALQRTAVAFNKMPLKYREVLYLNVIEGMSYEEVANTLNTKVGTIKSRLSRARSSLQDQLTTTKLGTREKQAEQASKPYCLQVGQAA